MRLSERIRENRLQRTIMADWSGRAERTARQQTGGGSEGAPTVSEVNATGLFILGLSELDGTDVLA